jgi:hypothetical protein
MRRRIHACHVRRRIHVHLERVIERESSESVRARERGVPVYLVCS